LNPNDKQEMRNYLLGTLDGDRKTELEEQILSVPEAYEELAIVEDELSEQYLAGGLSLLERQQFEANFLITVARQKNLRFAQLLKRYVNSHPFPVAPEEFTAAAVPHVEKTAPAKKSFTFSPLPAPGRPLIAFGITGVALLGIVFFGWTMLRRPGLRSVQQNADPVVVVTLAPANAPRVNVPPKGYNLKLELQIANPSFQNYKWELFRGNKSVQTSGELKGEAKGEQFVIPLTITGEILPGNYQVKLSGVSESGANAFIENYSFHVIE
jgi:hypothetical protein